MVVEDEAAVRGFVIDVLRRAGCRTLEAVERVRADLTYGEENIEDIDLILGRWPAGQRA